jgi:hypothetical protein
MKAMTKKKPSKARKTAKAVVIGFKPIALKKTTMKKK